MNKDSTKPSVLLINQVFYPDVAATAQHGHDLARHLVAKGHQVSVIASRSIYGSKGVALLSYEEFEGIQIHRVAKSYFGKSSILFRVFDFALFYFAATWKALWLKKHDVSICFTTPPFIALLGRILKMAKGSKMIYWVMDLYPDLPVACGVMKPSSLTTRFFESVNRYCLRSADAVVILGRCMRDRVIKKNIPSEKLSIIGVWADENEVKPTQRATNPYRMQWDIGDRFLVMYSGNFGLGHDVETFLDAAVQLQGDDRVRFAFVGGGKKKQIVEQRVKESGATNCILAPYQPREKLGELLTAADCQLISLLDGIEGIMVPCKLFGIMSAGRPALFIGSPTSEISRVIEESDCGNTVEQGDTDSLVKAILSYVNGEHDFKLAGERARTALKEKYSSNIRCQQWEQLIIQVAKK